jgi:predicted protein tyrosine phosphatase
MTRKENDMNTPSATVQADSKMDIYLHARTFFENRMGTMSERRMLHENRIISINDVANNPEPPPFSDYLLSSPNLLILFFDDVERIGKTAFTMPMARRIADFATSVAELPLHIHCTAGISRSGAVGLALAEHFGCRQKFCLENPDIQPNVLVLRMLKQALASLPTPHKETSPCE